MYSKLRTCLLPFFVMVLSVFANSIYAQTSGAVTFGYTGAPQTYTVPAGVTSLAVDARGASGGSGTGVFAGQDGGAGARVQTILPVTPGQLLLVLVGGAGNYTGGAGAVRGSYNGGGGSGWTGAAGGGASDVRRSGGTLTDRLVVAAGGGGGGNAGRSTQGGAGGAPNGGTGTINNTADLDYRYGIAGGATQTAGGTNSYPNNSVANGGWGEGGRGGYSGNPGGGGGGGYYGGAGGGATTQARPGAAVRRG